MIVSNLADLKQEIAMLCQSIPTLRQELLTKLQGFERREDLNRKLGDRLLSLTQSLNQLVTAIDRLNLPLTRAQNDVADIKADFSESRHEQRHELQKIAEKIGEIKAVVALIQNEVNSVSNRAAVISKDLDDVTGSFKVQQPTTKERIAALSFGALAKLPPMAQIVISVGIALAIIGGVVFGVYGLIHK